MRNIFLLSAGVCTLGAALAAAQAPDRRGLLPADEKQSVNKLAPGEERRSLREAPEARHLLAAPFGRDISEDKGAQYLAGVLDPRSLGRDLRESAPPRTVGFAPPMPGEKANVLPDSAASRYPGAAPDHYFLPEGPTVKPRSFGPPSQRR